MTYANEFVPTQPKTEAVWAEQAAVERILNAYLRETGLFDPRVKQPIDLLPSLQEGGTMFLLLLSISGVTLAGEMIFWSASGQHAYGSTFYRVKDALQEKITGQQVIELILDELSFLEKDEASRLQKKAELLQHIQNSMQKTEIYLCHANSRANQQKETQGFLQSEQSLYYGHPFHPTPKSSEGFTKQDLHQYAPELGASFVLHYLAVDPSLIQEAWIESADGVEPAITSIPRAIGELAEAKLGKTHASYKLLPCHPWQVRYLSQQTHLQPLFQAGKIIDLGPLGEKVYPTSSVRTVWDPAHAFFYKLPLQVRITNFIRVNTLEQVQRTLDAARVVAQVKDHLVHQRFQVVMEYGYRSLFVQEIEHSDNEQVIEASTVVFRENLEDFRSEEAAVYVVGSLMETPPGTAEPALFGMMRQSHCGELPDLGTWLRQYLTISMLPILRIFAETGISLEAHAQNSLVKLEKGMPAKLYVRDLEGISISREEALRHGWVEKLVAADSPVLYPEEEAWFRLHYYFFVNHLGYVVRTLARYGGQDEAVFWQEVRQVLLEERERAASERMLKYVDDLLTRETLPAKANLMSRFQRRGETPLYVNIPNPIVPVNEQKVQETF